jgi:peptidoglycan biosynthesis protein MviN/MurJ (putative lipid II flippase)
MQDTDIRKILCWIFACTSLLYFLLSLRSIYTISRHHAFVTLRNLLIAVLFEVVVAAITGITWWTILKGKPSAGGWGIAASLMYILIFLWPIIFSLRSVWPHHVGALVIGMVGLVAFVRRDEQTRSR